MRHFKFLLISIIFISCSGKRESIQRLKEFEYPLDSLNDGKLFVYKRNPPGAYYYVEQKRRVDQGLNYILQETYDTKHRISAEKYEITENGKQLVESYLYTYPDSISKEFTKDPLEIYELKNVNDNQAYRGLSVELRVITSGNIQAVTTAKELFKRKDKLSVMGQIEDVLVFTNDIKVKAHHRYLFFLSSESIYTGENFYAKRLGLVKYTTQKEGEFFEWELVEIKNLK